MVTHPFAELMGLISESQGEGVSCCRLDVNEKFYNPQGVISGGVLYSLADTGMGEALYPLLAVDEYCATIEIKISYFKPVRNGDLKCIAELLNKGKTIAYLESEIMNRGELVAKANGSFSIFKPNKNGS